MGLYNKSHNFIFIIIMSLIRVRNEDEDSIINYKVCSWSSLKIEGWSTGQESATSHNQLRLIIGASKIYITFKRNMSDSSIMSFRVVASLGECSHLNTHVSDHLTSDIG